MKFTLYAASLVVAANAAYSQADDELFQEYLAAQIMENHLSEEQVDALAQQYVQEQYAQNDAEEEGNYAEIDGEAQPIMTDLKWLGGKIANGARAVGRGIDAAYDGTKAGLKAAGSAVINAPGKALKAARAWKKRHNFTQANAGASGPAVAAASRAAAKRRSGK